ncbi:hypothetical protein NCC49_006027 [Naganishia albida]|nr:hypothetical protein NCC49_006027 [Naganishia albida]
MTPNRLEEMARNEVVEEREMAYHQRTIPGSYFHRRVPDDVVPRIYDDAPFLVRVRRNAQYQPSEPASEFTQTLNRLTFAIGDVLNRKNVRLYYGQGGLLMPFGGEDAADWRYEEYIKE